MSWWVQHREALWVAAAPLLLFIWSEVLGSNEKFKNNAVYQLIGDLFGLAKKDEGPKA
jgi:hypothetical protein